MSHEPEATGQDSEEVSRLVDAIEAFRAIEDPAERTKVASEALRRWPDLHSELRSIRQDSVLQLRDQGLTWPQIATIIGGGIKPERAQQIGKGLSGAQRKKNERAAKAEREE
ncbi:MULTISPECIES: hypothetical protein [Streptomyces]|uniref:RNA polymerase subunit sigma-70 n=1 Tax=Streptomyces canarius TaxID=285453 RepID=A0ABQ3CHN9_9ACTN|nr:hypothetical protein [Streptomyces canarius]GHA08699.1 hypothetical protein GCM10010345_11310 [Streptomyces canarius]